MRFGIKFVFAFALLSVFLLSFASAQYTLVFGKVYKSNLDSPGISGATVTVNCGGHTQTTTSKENDGGYFVSFSSDDCGEGDTASVTAQSGEMKGSGSFRVIPCGDNSKCTDESLDISYIAIVNPELAIPQTNVPRSGSGGKGPAPVIRNTSPNVTNTTKVVAPTVTQTPTTGNTPININAETEVDVTQATDNNEENGLAEVTGASILDGKGSWLAVVIILLAVILLIIIIMALSRRKLKSSR